MYIRFLFTVSTLMFNSVDKMEIIWVSSMSDYFILTFRSWSWFGSSCDPDQALKLMVVRIQIFFASSADHKDSVSCSNHDKELDPWGQNDILVCKEGRSERKIWQWSEHKTIWRQRINDRDLGENSRRRGMSSNHRNCGFWSF